MRMIIDRTTITETRLKLRVIQRLSKIFNEKEQLTGRTKRIRTSGLTKDHPPTKVEPNNKDRDKTVKVREKADST